MNGAGTLGAFFGITVGSMPTQYYGMTCRHVLSCKRCSSQSPGRNGASHRMGKRSRAPSVGARVVETKRNVGSTGKIFTTFTFFSTLFPCFFYPSSLLLLLSFSFFLHGLIFLSEFGFF
jgi:hypothetical protein